MQKYSVKLFLLFFSVVCFAQAPKNFQNCPPEGDNPSAKLQQLDRLKNRADAPAKIDKKITLSAILAKGSDADHWDPSEGAAVTGYVIEVKNGAKESCNCHNAKLLDTHIVLGLTPDAVAAQCMVVEVTPRWRSVHPEWSTANLKKMIGKRVTISGWLLFDAEHANASANTAKKGAKCWRATAWEIHPICAIASAIPTQK